VDRRITLDVDDDLGHTRAVAKVDEQKIAMVAALVHPSHEHSFLTGVGNAQRSTHVAAS
jgi:hypothetical protein